MFLLLEWINSFHLLKYFRYLSILGTLNFKGIYVKFLY